MPELDIALSGLSDRGLLTRMLTYAVRCPEVASVAVEKLIPTDFDEATQLEFMVVWHVARSYWRDYASVPPKHVLYDVPVNIMVREGYTDTVFHDSARRLVDEIYAFNESPWNVRYGLRLLNSFFDSVYGRTVGQASQVMPGGREDLKELADREYRRLEIEQMPAMDPFDFEAHPVEFKPRRETHVTPVDLLLGGGMAETECYGLLGPSGGGKTVLALQIAGAMALHREHVVYFSYEQPVAELRPRLFSFVAEVHIDKLRNRRFSEIDEKPRERLRKAAGTCKGYLNLVDRASEGSSITEIESYIRRRIDMNRKPRLVVIDWVWPLILRMTAASDRRNAVERIQLQYAMDRFKSLAAAYRTSFLILHQVSTELVKKSPAAKPEWFNSAEAGSFAWLLHFCFALGKADGNGYCWLVGSKTRNAPRRELIVKLDGGYNRFKPADQSMIYNIAEKSFLGTADIGRMPGAAEPSSGAGADRSDEHRDEIVGVDKKLLREPDESVYIGNREEGDI